jgi:CelD/BcsL family acetyltransferase involved in cellulose biosynthesis
VPRSHAADEEVGLADTVKAPRLLRNLRYARRRAETCGLVEIVEASRSTLDEMLSELFRLHQARWRERGEAGVLSDAAVQAMVRDAAGGFLARNWLRLYWLRIDGRTVAVQLGWAARARAYYYISGWDPEFAALSPGGLLVEHAVSAAVRESVREFDFLRGCERYKYDWGARDRAQHRRRFATSILP